MSEFDDDDDDDFDGDDELYSPATPVMTINIGERDDRMDLSLKFHKEISGKQLLATLASAVQGLIGSAKKIAGGYGLTPDQAVAVMLGMTEEEAKGAGELGGQPD